MCQLISSVIPDSEVLVKSSPLNCKCVDAVKNCYLESLVWWELDAKFLALSWLEHYQICSSGNRLSQELELGLHLTSKCGKYILKGNLNMKLKLYSVGIMWDKSVIKGEILMK